VTDDHPRTPSESGRISEDPNLEPERTVMGGRLPLRVSAPVELGSGSLLATRYQIEATIGRGGSGAVFRAWDRVLGEPIAIKILHPERARERSWIKRLAREVKVARAIRHPNVCRVFDLGNADGHWFVTMELATAGTLRDLLRAPDASQRPLVARLEDARALCSGLAAIHAVGIIHRDVTPQNVLRMADGRLVLSDFGLAIETTDNTTIHGGTPNYMPPETAMGQRADQRSDVWQLGAIMHEILFGRRPDWVRMDEGLTMKWPLPPDAPPVDEELARLCGDCLSPSQLARPATAMAVVGRLAAAEVARPRTPWQRAWLRVQRLARRHRRVGFAAAGVVLLAGVARGVQIATRPPLCRGADAKVEHVWDMRRKALVRRAFAHTGKTYASDTFWSVNRLLESYLGSWAGMYTEACEATHVRGEQSPEILDLRMACLNDRLDGVKALSQVFEQADGEIVDNAVAAVGALGTLDRCADPRLLRAMLPPPEDPAAREETERIRRALADAKALRDAGGVKAATGRLRALVADARRVGYAPVLAEALALLGATEMDLEHIDSADGAFKEAVWLAEASRHDEVKAVAATELVGTMVRRKRYDEADDWGKQADAILRRIGGHDRTRSWLETNVGVLRLDQGRGEEALAHERRAVELKESSGASRSDIARSMLNMAEALRSLGQTAAALDAAQRAEQGLRQELGSEHPLVGQISFNEGEILLELGRTAEARAAFTRALTIEERSAGRDSVLDAYALTGLGRIHLREHQAALAVPLLERALRIRRSSDTDAAARGETTFALARALSESGGDRERAERLAREARDIYRADVRLRERADEVERWLRDPRRSPITER
jgi:serine/threonine-protein kinase